jgi:SSS family transporter
MVITFIVCLLGFALIGISSVLRSDHTKSDYYLASSSVSPWLVGLSAVATNNSGYMFIGVIGYTYATGLASIWLMVGWLVGDFLSSLYVHKRLRAATERSGEVSYAGVLANWYGQGHASLQWVIGLVSLLFLITYAAAQLVAGSKALHVLLDWPLWSGAVMGAVMVTAYCFAGGIRASIWTDAAQSVVMMVAMAILLLTALVHLGGAGQALQQWQGIDGFMAWTPPDLAFPGLLGGVMFAASWLVAGWSVIGQPHIMVRFMTLADEGGMLRARLWYYLWFSIFYVMATAVGMLSRIYLADSGSFDAELALPTLAQLLLPGALVGVILAGIFAATMSTADSLVLSCSAALTHDLLPHKIERPLLLKLATVAVTGIALLLALSGSQSVFNMVILAWSGLASAFAPLLLVLCMGVRPGQLHSLLALGSGLLVAIVWRQLGWHASVYEGLPGVAVGLLILLPSLRQRRVAGAAA